MTMNIYVQKVVEFYLEGDPIPKTGIVSSIDGDQIFIKIQHGERHGELVIVNPDDVIDDSFDSYDCLDQKLYAWDNGD
jgi:hypothetical protein